MLVPWRVVISPNWDFCEIRWNKRLSLPQLPFVVKFGVTSLYFEQTEGKAAKPKISRPSDGKNWQAWTAPVKCLRLPVLPVTVPKTKWCLDWETKYAGTSMFAHDNIHKTKSLQKKTTQACFWPSSLLAVSVHHLLQLELLLLQQALLRQDLGPLWVTATCQPHGKQKRGFPANWNDRTYVKTLDVQDQWSSQHDPIHW